MSKQEKKQLDRSAMSLRDPNRKRTMGRIIKMLFQFYPVKTTALIIVTLIATFVSVAPAVFMQKALTIIEQFWKSGNWEAAKGPILHLITVLVILYIIGLSASVASSLLMPLVAQGSLMKIRNKMFHKMETLPLRYFDSNSFGDIMSHYTNDVDAMRQLISNGPLNFITSVLGMLGVLGIMFYYSVWMTLVVLACVVVMFSITGGLGAKAARFFKLQQVEIGRTEGFVEEAMSGMRTIKVFTHEKQTSEAFEKVNGDLFYASRTANRYANVLAPILFNMGNVAYVMVAFAGGAMLFFGTKNLSISGMALSIATVIPFLNMTKQFTGLIGQAARTVNTIIMGSAGAGRVFDLIDSTPESDTGTVTLVNAAIHDGQITECDKCQDLWAWKAGKDAQDQPEYRQLQGDIVLKDVDFGYNPDNLVLHDINLYAKPGQKVALVGATGAGKTTITNLLNRFYDINSGTITYDEIDIKDMKKADLRRSLGMVLQDTNLFSGTVMDNIRFGKLSASDEECIQAAKLARAHDFIQLLPNGYDTEIKNNGSNLSQGQRQLISIARAAVADPPVMILDEATSSIDTRTESLVQEGMDNLMKGRTTFVIAHRLSTVKNSDVICVMDHGRIIERGSHEELLKMRGTYYQLYTGAFELE